MPTGPPSNFSMIVEQELAVERVEALRVDFEQVERGARDGARRCVPSPFTCA